MVWGIIHNIIYYYGSGSERLCFHLPGTRSVEKKQQLPISLFLTHEERRHPDFQPVFETASRHSSGPLLDSDPHVNRICIHVPGMHRIMNQIYFHLPRWKKTKNRNHKIWIQAPTWCKNLHFMHNMITIRPKQKYVVFPVTQSVSKIKTFSYLPTQTFLQRLPETHIIFLSLTNLKFKI